MTQDTTNPKKSLSSTSLLVNHYSLLMDRMRSRKPTLKTQPSMAKATREDFKPTVEWSEEPSSRALLVLLPGFRREDVRVQIDNAGKLLVKGSRPADDNKVLVVDQSFDLPKDTIVEMISGRFEDGRLTLLMPRKVVEEQEAMQKATSKEKGKEGEKEEESVQKEAKKSEERKDEPVHKERPATTEEKHDDELTQKEKPRTSEDNKDQEPQKEKPKTEGEKKDGSPVLEEKQEGGEEKKADGPIRQQEMERGQEKKDEPVEKKSESVEEEKKEESAISSAMERVKEEKSIQKMKSKIREICADKPKEIRKKISNWRGAEGGRLDSGSFDGMLEKLNRNREVIAVAVVAFSVGFYVSHKLRTSGR